MRLPMRRAHAVIANAGIALASFGLAVTVLELVCRRLEAKAPMGAQGAAHVADWADWDEPFRTSYPEYVATQREKESSAYAVKAALQRSTAFDNLSEGWKSATKMHFGGVALVEVNPKSMSGRLLWLFPPKVAKAAP